MGSLHGTFWLDILSIILIDVLLAGDNAVLIAMAVKSLPAPQRRIGIAAGAGGAVVLRIVLTFFAAKILTISYLKLTGGVLILWIAVKLLTQSEQDTEGSPAQNLRQAIWLILVADITMSVDNILAVAAASKGSLLLLAVGLGLSITFVVFASSLLSKIMDNYPIVIWLGAAILGRVGGDMIATDPWVVRQFQPSEAVSIAFQVVCAAGILLAGWALGERKKSRKEIAERNV